MLKPGDKAPTFVLVDQHGTKRSLKQFAGRKLLLYFYPKADTPGCTQQSCLLSAIKDDVGRTAIVGVSPDSPARQLAFDTKHDLGFPLLSDEDHTVAKAYKVWKKKSMYGRQYMGIERSAFLIDGKGRILQSWYKVSPKDTVRLFMDALAT
jgi:peroxiredoxin Q/BCP